MKASELIKQLQKHIEENNDMEICIFDHDQDGCESGSVCVEYVNKIPDEYPYILLTPYEMNEINMTYL